MRFASVAILCALVGLVAQPIYAARAVFCCCETSSRTTHEEADTDSTDQCCRGGEAPAPEPDEPDDTDSGCECPSPCCNSAKPTPAATTFSPSLPALRESSETLSTLADRPTDVSTPGLKRPPRA